MCDTAAWRAQPLAPLGQQARSCRPSTPSTGRSRTRSTTSRHRATARAPARPARRRPCSSPAPSPWLGGRGRPPPPAGRRPWRRTRRRRRTRRARPCRSPCRRPSSRDGRRGGGPPGCGCAPPGARPPGSPAAASSVASASAERSSGGERHQATGVGWRSGQAGRGVDGVDELHRPDGVGRRGGEGGPVLDRGHERLELEVVGGLAAESLLAGAERGRDLHPVPVLGAERVEDGDLAVVARHLGVEAQHRGREHGAADVGAPAVGEGEVGVHGPVDAGGGELGLGAVHPRARGSTDAGG